MLLDLHRGVLHDVVDVGATEQCDVSAYGELVEGTFDRGVQIEIGLAVDGGPLLAGNVHQLEIRGFDCQIGAHAGEIGEIDFAVDRERLAVRGENGVTVEPHVVAVEPDRIFGRLECGPDHRHAEFRSGEMNSSVEDGLPGRSARTNLGEEISREVQQLFGQEDIGALQGESGDVEGGGQRGFSLFPVAGTGGQDLEAVQCDPGIGLLFGTLGIAGREYDIPESLLVVGESLHGERSLQTEGVGSHPQPQIAPQEPVDGRSCRQQLQHGPDSQSGHLEPDLLDCPRVRQ